MTSPETTVSYFIESREPGGEWAQHGLHCSWVPRATADERLASRREMQPGVEHRLVTRTTTVTEEPTR